jgi:hypothetical protein
MSGDAKRSMYEGLLVPTFLYGSEVWAASAEDRKRMGVLEIKCTRATCGANIMDIITNEVRRRCGSELKLSIGERMYRNVLMWSSHVERMDGKIVIKIVYMSKVVEEARN